VGKENVGREYSGKSASENMSRRNVPRRRKYTANHDFVIKAREVCGDELRHTQPIIYLYYPVPLGQYTPPTCQCIHRVGYGSLMRPESHTAIGPSKASTPLDNVLRGTSHATTLMDHHIIHTDTNHLRIV